MPADSSERYPHEAYTIRYVIVHEHFARGLREDCINDIALLELAESVVYRKHIVPICLPENDANLSGEAATAFGWGLNKASLLSFAPRTLETHVVDHEFCQAAIGHAISYVEVPKTWLCTGFVEGARRPCKGDSGSPLILTRGGRAQVIGILSFGRPCHELDALDIYTNVSNYVDWIKSNTCPDRSPQIDLDSVDLAKTSGK